ncbi:MAG TPA: DUF1161 domain-containing protein [Burkholderiales bacterium]|nr:DUF1161 domain-containing protein [Burkholderiales bacterium]
MPVLPGFSDSCGESGAYARQFQSVLSKYPDEGVSEMRTLVAMVALALAASPALAQTQRKDCGELKTEIEAKITANGVKVFTLTVADKDAAEDGKVVGTCDGGTKKIVYKRGAADAPRDTTGEAKSQPK